ncbi:thioesterase [Pseudonocardia sp. ICBG1122]|nr:thioesterase [Pseudonocardia pini]NWJ72074.1 thioesterase [Pseudonocardia pini]
MPSGAAPSIRPVPSPTIDRWLVRTPGSEDVARLFCFPYSGAGASSFSGWPHRIAGAAVHPLQFPGRENRLAEPPFETYEELVEALVPALGPHMDRPFAFFGHCTGALIAYETTRRLAGLGLPGPRILFASGQIAPQHADRDPMLTMTDDQLRAEIVEFLRERGIEPRPDIVAIGISVLRADLRAARRYRCDDPAELACPISVVRWRADARTDPDLLARWSRCSTRTALHDLPGGQHGFGDAPTELRRLLGSWR